MIDNEKLVPNLRFEGFTKTWVSHKVQDIASKLKVGFVGTCEPYFTAPEKGILLVRTGNLKGVNIILDEEKYVTREFHDKNKKSQVFPNDLLLARHGGNGEICRVPDNFPVANCLNIVILRTDETVLSEFFQLAYGTERIQKQVEAVTAGSTQTVINTREIGKLELAIPSLPEQRKVADFLAAVDKRIGLLMQKKALLEDYKKGVMQQLFTQAIRFKDEDGNDFPDWEEKQLGEVSELVGGLTYSPDDVAEAGLLVLRSSNIQGGKIVFDDNVFVTTEVNEWNLSRSGDILICVRNGSKRLIGKNAIIPKGCPQSTHCAFMTVLRGNQNQYLFQLLQADIYKRNVHRNLGATINSINGSDLKKFKFMFPSKEEQEKIATFLSVNDKKIEAVTTQITETQTFKRGLLQQMFV